MKHALIPLLASLLLASCHTQDGEYTVRGCISNGAGGIPNVIVILGEDTVSTDLEGQFVFNNVKQGRKELIVDEPYGRTSKKIRVRSNITLDTIVIEEKFLGETIWFLQSHSTIDEPYMRQYIDFRRAIDSLPLVLVTDSVLDHYNVDSITDANGVIGALRGVALEKGWLLDVYYGGDDMGGSVMFYTRHEGEAKIPMNGEIERPAYGLQPHIQVDFTPQGIWSAYQLSQSHRYLPKFWHAHYSESCGVFTLDEVRRRSPALRDSLASTPEIRNRVEIIDDDHAIVTAYWWNDWTGLYEETVFVERTDRTVRFIFPDRDNPDPRTSMRIIVPYDCGIMF